MSRKKQKTAAPVQEEAGLPSRFPAGPFHWAFLAWSAWVAVKFIGRGVKLHPWMWAEFGRLAVEAGPVLRAALPDFGRLVLFWAGLGAAGKLMLRKIAPEAGEGKDGLVYAAGLGLWAVSTGMLGLGLAGLWKISFLRVGFYFGGVAGVVFWVYEKIKPTEKISTTEPGRENSGTEQNRFTMELGIACAIISAAALLGLLAALTPEIFYDALVYHLGLPKLYLLRGAVGPTPHSLYSGLPMGVQMLYGLALAVSGESLACLIHWSLGLAAMGALYLWGLRYWGRSTAILAALLFYLCPAVIYAGWHAGVDLGSSFLCLGAFLAMSRSLEDPAGPGLRWSVLAGLLTGAAMGTKYNVFPVGALLVAVHALAGRRRGVPFSWSGAMAAAAGLALLPWPAKNALFYGNPLYPFFHGVVGSASPAHWDQFLSDASRGLGTLGTGAGLKELLVQPWATSMGDWPMGDWPGPSYLILGPWVLAFKWAAFPEMILAWSAAGGYGAWALSSRLFRYFLPALGFLSLATAAAVDRGRMPPWARRLGWLAALGFCAYGLESAYFQGRAIGLWNYLRDPDRAVYLKGERVTYAHPYYGAMEFINRQTPPGARILFLGEARGYYCERDFIASTVFDRNPFWEDLRASKNAGELLLRLRERGVTHVFLNAWEMASRREYDAVFPRGEIRGPLFAEFWDRALESLYEERDDKPPFPKWLGVYALRPELAKPGAGPPNVPQLVLRSLEKLESAK